MSVTGHTQHNGIPKQQKLEIPKKEMLETRAATLS